MALAITASKAASVAMSAAAAAVAPLTTRKRGFGVPGSEGAAEGAGEGAGGAELSGLENGRVASEGDPRMAVEASG